MVGYRRNLVPGGTYFFTVAIADRRSSVLIDRITSLRAAFRTARRERPFTIDAIVILPEHLHAIFTLPPDDAGFSGRWRRIKGLFTHDVARRQSFERSRKGEYVLWQRRFWKHTIRDETNFARHVDYIHFNPVKHGLVTQVTQWPHSSFHRYVREGVLPRDWGGDIKYSGKGLGERRD